MTTIAVDTSLTMAADSQATIDCRRVQRPVIKIFQIRGYTVGIAGRYSEGLAFIEALEDILERNRLQELTYLPIPESMVDEMDNFHALMITPEGEILEYEGSRYSIPVEAPVAIGSGADFALAAMECGKSSSEAVQVAVKFDVFSGGEIQIATPQQEPERVTREELSKKTKKELLDILTGDENDGLDQDGLTEPDT